MKKHPADLLWLIRFCIRTSPKLFFFNIFACVEQSLFVFFEYTIWIGYNLNAAENGAPFSQVALDGRICTVPHPSVHRQHLLSMVF